MAQAGMSISNIIYYHLSLFIYGEFPSQSEAICVPLLKSQNLLYLYYIFMSPIYYWAKMS